MSLFGEVKCRRCDRRYSALRRRCPYCGARKNRGTKKSPSASNAQWQMIAGAALLLVIIVAVIVLIVMSIRGGKDEGPDTSPTAPSSSSTITENVASPSTSPTDLLQSPSPSQSPDIVDTVRSITLNRDDFTLSYIGETWQMEATLTPSTSAAKVTWSIEDTNVAIVSEDGVVTAVDRGDTILTASAGGATATCIVRVNADASDNQNVTNNTGIEISHTDVTISSSSSETFVISVEGATGTPSFSSDDSSIASVEANGRVTAVSPGDTIINVTVDGVTLTCIVRVN